MSDAKIHIELIDLDHFKTINDARGHATGDILLIEVAKRLSDLLREVDTVARIGGDEFVVLIDSLDSHIEVAGKLALKVAEKVRQALSGRGIRRRPTRPTSARPQPVRRSGHRTAG